MLFPWHLAGVKKQIFRWECDKNLYRLHANLSIESSVSGDYLSSGAKMSKREKPNRSSQYFKVPQIRKRTQSLPSGSCWTPRPLNFDIHNLTMPGMEETKESSSESSPGQAAAYPHPSFLYETENVVSKPPRSKTQQYFLSQQFLNPQFLNPLAPSPQSSGRSSRRSSQSVPIHSQTKINYSKLGRSFSQFWSKRTSSPRQRQSSLPKVLLKGATLSDLSPTIEHIQSSKPRVSVRPTRPPHRKNLVAFAFGYPADSHWISKSSTPQVALALLPEHVINEPDLHQERPGVTKQTFIYTICSLVSVICLMAIVSGLLLHQYVNIEPQEPFKEIEIKSDGPVERKPIVHPHDFSNINTMEDACDNFYLFGCRDKKNHWRKPNLKNPFQKDTEKLISDDIKKLLTMDFNRHRQPISASHTNLQTFYKACTILCEADPIINTKQNGTRSFWHLIKEVTGKSVVAGQNLTWELITLNAFKHGFHPFFFVNITTVLSENGAINLKVEPPLFLNQYGRAWKNIKPLIDIVTEPNSRDKDIETYLPKFAKGLQTIIFENYENSSLFSSKVPDEEFLELLQEVTKNATLKQEDVVGFGQMSLYIESLRKYLNETRTEIWLTYVNIIMFLNDCRYLPIDQRQLCSTYLVGDPLLKMIDYEEYCFLTTLQSPWFIGVAEANYIEFAKFEVGFDTKFYTAIDVFRNVYKAMKKWLQDDPWLSEIYENGAKEHFENLEISVGWRDLKFNLNSFEGVHETYTMQLSNKSIFHMVHEMRRQFFMDQLNSTKMVKKRSQAPLTIPKLSGYVEYDKEKHTIGENPILGYSAIQLQRYNPLPQSVLYGSLGEWLASAMQQIFDFPELKNATCIFPHSRWKYNWLLYTEEYVKCMKRQYNEFNHVFRIGGERLNETDFETTLSAIIGSEIAYRAYVHSSGQDHEKLHRIDADVSFTGGQLFWLTWMFFRCGTETLHPGFTIMGPSYTSQKFSTAFDCDKTSKMYSKSNCTFQIPEMFL